MLIERVEKATNVSGEVFYGFISQHLQLQIW